MQENSEFVVSASLSNLFGESGTISMSNMATTFDLPSIKVEAAINHLNNDPVVALNGFSSTVTEKTSTYDLYIEMTAFRLNTSNEIYDFFTTTNGLNPRLSNQDPGVDVDFVQYLNSSNIRMYWIQENSTTLKPTPLTP